MLAKRHDDGAIWIMTPSTALPLRDIDIVIPVYNEGPNIVACLNALRAGVRADFRVLICYDFDEDETLAALKDPSLTGIDLVTVRNARPGVHGAVVSGLRASTAPAVAIYAADDDYNARYVDAMLEAFRGGADIVVGCRMAPESRWRNIPFLKRLFPWAASLMLRLLAGFPTRDATNGIRLFSRRVIDTIEIESSVGFTYAIELTAKAHRLGWPIRDVTVDWIARTAGESRFRLFTWIPEYLPWFFYALATLWLRRGPDTVPLRTAQMPAGTDHLRT